MKIRNPLHFGAGLFCIGCAIAALILNKGSFVVGFCVFSSVANLMIGFFGS
jgi:hypothetical protein